MSGIQTRAAIKESFNGFEGIAVYFNSVLTITSTAVNIAEAMQGEGKNSALLAVAITINIVSIIFDAICSYNKMQNLNGDSGARKKYNDTFHNPVNAQNQIKVEDPNNEWIAPVVGIVVGGLTLGLGFFGKSRIGNNTANTFQILSPVISNVICDIAQHVADSERSVLEKAINNRANANAADIENQIQWCCGF